MKSKQKTSAADLAETFVELAKDAFLVEHFSVVPSFVIVGDTLSQLTRQLAADHVLFDLLQLQNRSTSAGECFAHALSRERKPDVTNRVKIVRTCVYLCWR
jgi:hypothetical protein